MHPLRAVVVLCLIIEAGCTTTAPDTIETPVSQTPSTATPIETIVTLITPRSPPTSGSPTQRICASITNQSGLGRARSPCTAKHDSFLLLAAKRGQRYFAYIAEEVRQRNMPMEVALP